MEKICKALAALSLPLSFAYFEAVLRIFGEGGLVNLGCLGISLAFGISAGLLLAALFSLLPKRAKDICTGVILGILGLAFTAEALIQKSFNAYMSPSSVFSGARGVIENYGSNLAAAVIGGIPQILLFAAPAAVYILFCSRYSGGRAKPVFPIASALLSAGVFCAASFSADTVNFAGDFSGYTENFGLLTALRLNISGDSAFSGESGFDFASVNNLTLGKSEPSVPAVSPNIKSPVPLTLGKSESLPTLGETCDITDNTEIPESTEISEYTESTKTPESAEIPEYTESIGNEKNITVGSSDNSSAYAVPVRTEIPAAAPNPEPIPPKKPAEDELAALQASGENVMLLDFDGAYARTKNSAVAELNQYVRSLAPSNKNAYTGLFSGKNLILVCAEAFSYAAIDENLTPTLYRMTHNGIYFSDYYQPTWGGSTTTGEFSFVTGLVPESGLVSMQKTAGNNNYFTLGNQLQRIGYSSGAFHNGNYDYYSRNLTHRNLGYTDFLAFGNGLENITRKYSEDSAMIDKTVDLYLDKQPFSLYYMTVSGHFSYKSDNVKVKENLPRVREVFGSKYKDKTEYYFCYQMEVDKAMEMLINKLTEAGIADDTVICLTADHYPYGLEKSSTYGNSEDYLTDLYGGSHSYPWERDKNALILWSGCLENECKEYACEIASPAYSLDIVPTLSNLFGLEYDSRLLVGRDVFSDEPALALWNSLNWVTDRGRYNAKTKEFFPAPGFTYDKDYVSGINGIVKNKIYFSGQTVNTDYYRALFGEDEYK